VVQGSVIVAVGASFPELASVVVTAIPGTFNMGVGAIVGSAIFNILVIPALAGLASTGELETNRSILYKEAQYYMIAVSVVVVMDRSSSFDDRFEKSRETCIGALVNDR
jgi:cation:H+ antiporter